MNKRLALKSHVQTSESGRVFVLKTGLMDGSTEYFCEVAHARAENLKKPE